MTKKLIAKLHPKRFPGMSGKMAAIVGYVLDQKYTDPAIEEIVVTSDGMVLSRVEGDCGCNDMIGSYEDLERNIGNLLTAAELTPEEKAAWSHCFKRRIVVFGSLRNAAAN